MTATRCGTGGFIVLMAMATLLFATLVHPVEASDETDKTTFIIEPYLWLPTFKRRLELCDSAERMAESVTKGKGDAP